MTGTSSFTTASDYVYQQLRKRIFEKTLERGQRLPEIALSKELNVSRTPVREALRRLAGEGLVRIIPNWGASLVSPTMKEVIDTYELRAELEVMAIKKAVSNVTPLMLCRLQEQIDMERKIFLAKDLEAYLNINNEFHAIIAEASGNMTLAAYVRNILSLTFVQMIFCESFFHLTANPSLEEHIEILEALTQRDKDRCVMLMNEHICQSLEELRRADLP